MATRAFSISAKKGFTRIFLVVSIGIVWAGMAWLDVNWPQRSAADAVAAVNGGNIAAVRLRHDERLKNDAAMLAAAWTMFAVAGLALSFYPRRWQMRISPLALAMLAILPMTQGCARSYDTPEYQDVDTAETAFVVPLEGDTADQAKFDSEEFLEEHKVAAKRVQITHRWEQTGRSFLWMETGQWIPDVRLIKVNRSPITRQWTADTDKDNAIWV
ncbi:MAG TPA: hypothetical protein VMD30_09275, partial [Tepidisphaeraceae bacterium]|nr:hypothetical protein [Tepidisphaeraceae bacterium]